MSELQAGTGAEIAPGEYTGPAQRASLAERWYAAVMMCLVYTLSICDRYSISTVLEPIRRELHLSDANIAFLTGVSLAIFYVTFGFPLSWLIDRRSRRNIIGICLIAWSLLTVATGLARSYWQLLWARIGVGVGEAGGTPGANSMLSDFFPAARRPMALSVFALGAPIGAWLGSQVAGAIAYRLGWRAMFLALGIPGVLAGLLVLFSIREPRRGCLDKCEACAAAPSFFETMEFLLSQRSAVHSIVAQSLTALWGWGLMWWTPAFLMRSYSLDVAQAGGILGPVHLIGGSAAMIGSTWLLSRRWLSDERRVMRLLGLNIALATVVTAIIYSTHSLALTKALFWLYIPSIYVYLGPGFGILNNLAQPKMRAMYCAVLLFLANVCNLVIAPQMVGWLSDWFAPHHVPDAQSLRLAMLCLVPTGLWAAWHYWLSARDLLQDEQLAQRAAAGLPAGAQS
ncbi:MAG TPA: MFS transporter [Steroidobacteraceae bacterium]|nr:MFS transporter [Steroidobacteraceae bacterium]